MHSLQGRNQIFEIDEAKLGGGGGGGGEGEGGRVLAACLPQTPFLPLQGL